MLMANDFVVVSPVGPVQVSVKVLAVSIVTLSDPPLPFHAIAFEPDQSPPATQEATSFIWYQLSVADVPDATEDSAVVKLKTGAAAVPAHDPHDPPQSFPVSLPFWMPSLQEGATFWVTVATVVVFVAVPALPAEARSSCTLG